MPSRHRTRTFDDGELALDALAHLLADWAQSRPDPEGPDAGYAEGTAEIYCTCRHGGRSAEHHDALNAVTHGHGVREQLGIRVFELLTCTEIDCPE